MDRSIGYHCNELQDVHSSLLIDHNGKTKQPQFNMQPELPISHLCKMEGIFATRKTVRICNVLCCFHKNNLVPLGSAACLL